MTKHKRHIAEKIKQQVINRDGFQCRYCRAQLGSAEVVLDHVLPVSDGGQNTCENLVVSCDRCNERKGRKRRCLDRRDGIVHDLAPPQIKDWHKHFQKRPGSHPIGRTSLGRAIQNALWQKAYFHHDEMPEWTYAANLSDASVRDRLTLSFWAREHGDYEEYRRNFESINSIIQNSISNPEVGRIRVLMDYLEIKKSVNRSAFHDLKDCLAACHRLLKVKDLPTSIRRDVINHLSIAYKQISCMHYLRYNEHRPYSELAMFYSALFNRNFANVGIYNSENSLNSFTAGRQLRNIALHAEFNRDFRKDAKNLLPIVQRVVQQSDRGYNQDTLRFATDFVQETNSGSSDFRYFLAEQIEEEVDKIGYAFGRSGLMSAYVVRRATFLLVSVSDKYVDRLKRDCEYFLDQELFNELREIFRSCLLLSASSNRNMSKIKECLLSFVNQSRIRKYNGSITKRDFLYEMDTLEIAALRF